MQHRAIAGLAAATLSVLSVGPVLAAVPSNDGYAGRIVVGQLPFETVVDTADATTDADDADANVGCGAPATDASVWYEYTAASDGPVILDASASSYSAGFLVATGVPGSFSPEGCGPGQLTIYAVAGVTYAILVFDDQLDEAGNGGSLQLSITTAGPPPVVDLTVDATGTFEPRTGAAIIRGTVTCTGGSVETEGKSFINVQLRQLVGRIAINAEGGTDFACDGETHPWSVELLSLAGKFGGGRATVAAFSFACGVFDCASDSVDQTVTLRR
jgi:hypothetical protein